MLDIGWSEMAVIAIVVLLVVGPKDIPRVLRTVGQWVRKARSITSEFQASLDEMVREADLEDARKAFDKTKRLNLSDEIERSIDPTGSIKKEARELETAARADSSESTAKKAEAELAEAADAESEVAQPTAAPAEAGETPAADAGGPTLVEPSADDYPARDFPARPSPGASLRPAPQAPAAETGGDVGGSEEPEPARVGEGRT